MNCDARDSFTELVHTADCGQVSINVSKPRITQGQHWHNAKWEQFIVVHGHGLIREQNIQTGETVEFEVLRQNRGYLHDSWMNPQHYQPEQYRRSSEDDDLQ